MKNTGNGQRNQTQGKKLSFLKEKNSIPMQESGQLTFIDHNKPKISHNSPLGFDIRFVRRS